MKTLLRLLIAAVVATPAVAAADTIVLHPIGPGYSGAGTPTGSANRFDCVNDQDANASSGAAVVPGDLDATYVLYNGITGFDAYALQGADIPSGSTITALSIWANARKTANQAVHLTLFYRLGSQNFPGTDYNVPAQTYGTWSNGFTGLNITDWSTLELGVNVTDSSPAVRLSQLWVEVTYTPPALNDTLTTSNPVPVQSAAVNAGAAGVVMQRFQVDSNTGGNGSVSLTSLTVDDLGSAGAGDFASLQVFLDTNTDCAGATLVGQVASWTGTSTTVTLDQGTAADRTVTNPTPKYVCIVYNLNAAAEGETLQSRVTAVGVASPDLGASGLTYTSNLVNVNVDALTASGNTPVQATSPVSGATGVVMQYFQVSAGTAGNDSIELASVTIDDLGTAAAGDLDALRIYVDTDTTFAGAVQIGQVSSWGGTSTSVALSLGTAADRTVAAGTPKYLFVVYDLSAASAGKTLQSRVSTVGVAAPDAAATGLAFSSNALTVAAPSPDHLSASGNTPVQASAVNAGTTGVAMQVFQVSTDNAGNGSVSLSSVTVDDLGTAALGHFSSVKIYADSDATFAGAVLVGETSGFPGTATAIPLTLGSAADRTVAFGAPKYLTVVYDVADAAEGQSLRSRVTAVGVASPDSGVTGLALDSNLVTVNTDTLTASGNTPVQVTNPSAGQTDVVMQVFQVSANTAGSNSVELSSVTVDDRGNAGAGHFDAVEIWMDTDATFAGAVLVGRVTAWGGTATSVPLSLGTAADRTVTSGSPKYVYVVYDISATAAGRTLQSRVTAVAVAAPDTGATALVFDSNPLSVAAAITLTVSNPGTQPLGASVPAGSGGVFAGKFRLTASSGTVVVTSMRVANAGTALAGSDVSAVQFFRDANANGTLELGTDTFLGNGRWEAGVSRFVLSGLALNVVSGSPATILVAISTATSAVTARTFVMRIADGDVAVQPAPIVPSFTAFSANTFTIGASAAAGSANGNAPTVLLLNPANGAAVSGTFRVQVQVYNPAGLAGLAAALSTNGGATFPTALSASPNYSVGTNAAVYEATLSLSAGSYSLQARATNAASLSATSTIAVVTVNPAGTGDGNLLVRDNSNQLCSDCHALPTHSSQSTGPSYGSWAVGCRDCHTPHGTTNAYLVRNVIQPPNFGTHLPEQQVRFSKRTGYTPSAAPADATYTSASNNGPCQACHTRTSGPGGIARFRNTAAGGNADTHYTSPTQDCAECHKHTEGFKGSGVCATCHVGAVDLDSYAWGDNNTARIDPTEWTTYGHGRGSAFLSGNGAAGFDGQGTADGDRGCAYCHSEGVGHQAAGNWFRLANTALGLNGTCLVCHGAGNSGYDPGANYALIDGKNVDSNHWTSAHPANHNGGRLCWDCHDPHGDTSSAGNALWYMIQRRPVESTDAQELPLTYAAAVEFRAQTGGNTSVLDYADYTAGGLCRNCHDSPPVAHYSKTLTDGHGTAGSPNGRCTGCHKHQNRFEAACNSCHSAPPGTGKHLAHDEVAALPTSYTDTASHASSTQYGYACAKCHTAAHMDAANAGTLGDPLAVQVAFDTTSDPRNTGGSYGASTAQSELGPDGRYYRWSNGTCSATYCHSNGRGTSVPVTWTAELDCTGCHGTAGAASTLSVAHRIHTDPAKYAYGCERCHVATGTAAAISNKALHADGFKQVGFDTSGADNSGGGWNGTTCSATYCHSDGTDRSAPYGSPASIAWTASGTCRSCHGGNATSAPTMATGKHGLHVNNPLLGTQYGCAACHNATVGAGADEAITGWSSHVNQSPSVSMGSGSYVAPTCSNNYCHSSGQATPTYRNVTWTEAAWTSVCDKCHGLGTGTGAPNYGSGAAGSATANSHGAHVNASTDCATCHRLTATAAGTAITSDGEHTDGTRDVYFDLTRAGSGATYTAGGATPKSCSTTYCHGSGSVQWGATLTCASCHSANNALATPHGKHFESTTTVTATSAAFGSTATQYQYGCGYCHPTGTNHANGAVSARQAAQVAFSGTLPSGQGVSGTYTAAGTAAGTDRGFSYTAGTCASAYCHSNAAPLGGTNSTKSPTWSGTLGCNGCHSVIARSDAGALTDLSNAHGVHIQSTSAETGSYAFRCNECHAGVMVSSPNPPWLLADADLGNKTNHVRGEHTVNFSSAFAGTVNQSSGAYNGTGYTCSSTYCHSDGTTTAAPFGSNVSIAWNSTADAECDSCHGGNAAATATTGKGPLSTLSHGKHIGAPFSYACGSCHNTVVGTANDRLVLAAGKSLHVNAVPNVSMAGGTWTDPTCSVSACHGSATPTWGGSATCLSCHGTSGTETNDLGASFWSNNTLSTISTTEWTWSGHGRTGTACTPPGTLTNCYDVTQNPAANLPTAPTPGTSECLYCHDNSVGHRVATNPFRLRNTGGADGQNGVCFACHKAASAGVTPSGQANKNATIKVDTHNGAKHTGAAMGGKFCWDCHDPHGDRPSNTNSSSYNIAMIGKTVRKVSDGTYGYTGATGVEVAVEFYNETAAITRPSPVGRIVETTTALNTTHRGVCQGCHDIGTTASTKYWGASGYDDPDLNGAAAAYASGVTTGTHHNTTSFCLGCHPHSAKFKGSGGGPDCLGCHGGQQQGSRRAVTADFANGTTPNFRSHHVGNGSTLTLRGTLNNYDCVVCHAEGQVVSGISQDCPSGTFPTTCTNPTHHANGTIDLRNVDTAAPAIDGTGTTFVYDKDAVAGSAGAAANWNSGNQLWREWTSGVDEAGGATLPANAGLDKFCLTCHDSNGASQVTTFRETSSQTSGNPFADNAVTNNYDAATRPAVTDIATRVASAWPNGPSGAYTATDRDNGYAPAGVLVRGADTRPDPPEGVFARHAIRGQSVSTYGTTNANWDTSTYWVGSWNSRSVMGCADCHTVDGANGTSGNAHGSGSEYLLKDASGGATEGRMGTRTTAGSYVCYACHPGSHYDLEGASFGHTGNGQDYQEYVTAVGTARLPVSASGGNIYGYACGNCHGGGPPNKTGATFPTGSSGATGFGTIHGTSQVLGIGSATGTSRPAYRFTNGNSMRYYDPVDWSSSTGRSCYTIGSGDSWGGCNKHSSSGGGQNMSLSKQRPLNY